MHGSKTHMYSTRLLTQDPSFLGKSLLGKNMTFQLIPGSFSHFGTFPDAVLLAGGCGTSRVATDAVCSVTAHSSASSGSGGGPKTGSELGREV